MTTPKLSWMSVKVIHFIKWVLEKIHCNLIKSRVLTQILEWKLLHEDAANNFRRRKQKT